MSEILKELGAEEIDYEYDEDIDKVGLEQLLKG